MYDNILYHHFEDITGPHVVFNTHKTCELLKKDWAVIKTLNFIFFGQNSKFFCENRKFFDEKGKFFMKSANFYLKTANFFWIPQIFARKPQILFWKTQILVINALFLLKKNQTYSIFSWVRIFFRFASFFF